MAQSKIRWKQSDYITLGRAVSQFNKTVRKLEAEESSLVLPDIIDYQDTKSGITTRNELKRMIKALKRFQLPNQQKAISLDSDLEVTNWEYTELKKARKRASRRLTGELAGLEAGLGTGNTRINEIKSTLESFDRLETLDKKEYLRKRRMILNQGVSDFDMKKATQFQKNFIQAYKKMGRTEIVEIAQNFRNPLDFWEFIKDSEFTDIRMKYDEDSGLIQLGEMTKDESYYYELNKLKK